EDGGKLATIHMSNGDIEVDNWWVVPYSPLLLKALKAHTKIPAVVHFAVYLENGRRVYFTIANVQQIALNPPATTLTTFSTLCQNDSFAKTLLYSEVPTYYTWNASRKSFERRKRGKPVAGQPGIFKETMIGRLYTVHLRTNASSFVCC
ncbi:unnamed protein product, partial [Onchocerca ochengi]|uniref:DPPIV_N domain-containing protein n=1 Tax=Onchocerca ochengi TaxID=42157 RepID=A0A182EY64_ONCOC